MNCYKLHEFTIQAEKYQKFKGYNGRVDIEYKLNNGIVEIKDIIDRLYNLYDDVDVSMAITYINQVVSYYIELSIEDGKQDMITTGRSAWQSIELTEIPLEIEKKLYGACHVSTSDDMSLNLIDEIVRSHSNSNFTVKFCFKLSKKNHDYELLLSKLANRIRFLSEIKETTKSKSIVIVTSGNQSRYIRPETLHNYLSELYYLYRSSSSFCKNPALVVHTESQEIADSITSLIIQRSHNKNTYYFDYLFDEEAYGGFKNESKEKGFFENLFSEDKSDEYLFNRNFIISQLVPTSFVASVLALPNTKIPGISYIDEYDYGTIEELGFNHPHALSLGYLNKNFQTDLPVCIDCNDLVMHTLVTGVTGSGKTTTIRSILSKITNYMLPFLVLEPAKTEYQTMDIGGLTRYLVGIETGNCLKINPFEFPFNPKSYHGIHLQTHLDLLKSIFVAAFPMYGPMPYVLETAFYHIYQWYGWDFKSGHNIYWDSVETKSDIFPTLDDMYNAIDHVVSIQGYSKDLQNDLTAALKVRIGSLKSGAKGTMLNTKRGTGIGELLSCPTVIELERIGDAQEKVFIMGLLLVSIYEHYIAQGQQSDGKLKHLMVIEEAHRLLENVQQNNNNEIADMKGKALETFNNILSEIRSYGQGIVVADQIPTKISPDVIKNTNLKIVHRLFAMDDRNAIGDSIGLDHKQKKGLIHLKTGEAIVLHSKLQDAVKIKVSSKGLEKGDGLDTIEGAILDTLDIVVNTTRVYTELKKMFQTAIVLDWSYEKLSEKITANLVRYGFEVEEHLVEGLISKLVVWLSINLRNNLSISYDFINEMEIKKIADTPFSAVEEIRRYIHKHGHIIQFPVSLESIYVEALVYFLYVFTEDRKGLSSIMCEIQASHPGSFRFYHSEVQNVLLYESEMDRYLCLDLLSEKEKLSICQCLVYFCSYPHTDFLEYFDVPYAPLSDNEYLEFLKEPEKQTVRPTKGDLHTDNIDVKPMLMSIVENLQVIGSKQGLDPNFIKRFLRLPIAILLINSLMIVLAILVIILK